MAVGVATSRLNTLLDTFYPNSASRWVQLHTGDPGASGTSNVSSVTTRPGLTFNSASGASKTLAATPQWTNWAGTNGEVVTHISVWDASTSGTYLGSIALAASKTMTTGDTLTLNTLTSSMSPVAA